MHKGKVLREDEPKNVRSSLGLPMIEVWPENARLAAERVRNVSGVHGVSLYGDRLHIALEKKEATAEVIAELQHSGIAIKDFREILPSLEDVFIAMVER